MTEIPDGFTPVPDEFGLYFCLGRNIPTTGRWERTENLPINHHERRWWRGPMREEELDLALIVRQAPRLTEQRTIPNLPGCCLASSGALVDHITVWANGHAAYYNAEGIMLGSAPKETMVWVFVTQTVQDALDDPNIEEVDRGS